MNRVVAPDRNDETGQYTEEYPDESFLEAVSELDPATTSRVAEMVGCSYDLAYRRLQDLNENEALTRIRVGGSFVWKIND